MKIQINNAIMMQILIRLIHVYRIKMKTHGMLILILTIMHIQINRQMIRIITKTTTKTITKTTTKTTTKTINTITIRTKIILKIKDQIKIKIKMILTKALINLITNKPI